MVQSKTLLDNYPVVVASEIIEMTRSLYKKHPEEKELFKDILNKLFRRASDRIKVKYASEDALKFAKENGIDLANLTWDKQTRYDKDRKILHFEHCFPIRQLIKRCLETDESPESITNDNFVAWITKDENKRLDGSGFNSERPEGWEKCYEKCGIKIHKI